MNVVVVGCGRVGARVAGELSRSHHVSVVDWRRSSFERLPSDFSGELVQGNGIDLDVLRTAGIDTADVVLALTDDDNRNLMVAQEASQVGVRNCIARVYDVERCHTFSHMGIETVSPTILGAQRLFDMVVGPEEE